MLRSHVLVQCADVIAARDRQLIGPAHPPPHPQDIQCLLADAHDVGGFVGDATTKLFARWISIGAFSPFFRGHSMINSRDAEPWAYGEEVEQISRNYIKFRYQLLPYIYSLYFEATQTGMPLQRSLAIDYPHDHKVFSGAFQNQYLFGPYFLVAPVDSNKDLLRVYLPQGLWYYLYDGRRYEGNLEIVVDCPLHKLPVFVRAGAIVPMQPIKSHTGEASQTLILHVYTGDSSTFRYYEDDGVSYDFENGEYAVRTIIHDHEKRSIFLSAVEGKYQSKNKRLRVVFHGLDGNAERVSVNGTELQLVRDLNISFVALEKFDPIHDPDPAPQQNVHTTELDYVLEEIVIKF